MFEKFGKHIVIGILCITAVQVYFISTLKFEYDFENFFSSNDPDLTFFQDFRETYGNDNDFLLIGLKNEPTIFDSTFLSKVDLLTKKLIDLPYVLDVHSPTNLENVTIRKDPFLRVDIPSKSLFLNPAQPDHFARDSTNIYQFDELVGTFFSEHATSLAIFIQTEERLTKDQADTLHTQLDATLKNLQFQETHVAGKSRAESVYIKKMEIEMLVFVTSSVVLIIAFLFIAYRSIWGVILPMFIVLLAVIWSLGAMGIGGKPIDIMTTLLPTIMFVVGMSDVVHIVTKYLEELRNGKEKQLALNTTIKEVGLATFLTSLTTAIGFLTLLSTGVKPIMDFGLYCSIAVFLAFFLAFTFLPAILAQLPVPKVALRPSNEQFWNKNLHRLLRWIFSNKKKIIASAILLTGISIVGIYQIKLDAHLIDEVSDKDPLKQDFIFFEKEFSGVRPFEMAIEIQDTSKTILDYEVMKEIEKMQKHLKSDFGVKNMFSPVSFVKTLNRTYNGGIPENYRIPENQKAYKKLKRTMLMAKKMPEFKQIIRSDLKQGRISGKMIDIGTLKASAHKEDMLAFQKSEIDSSLVKFTITGSANLIDKTNTSLAKNMMFGLAIAFIAIAIIMGLLYKSLRIVLISFIPNVIPLLFIGGIIGFGGIGLKMSTSIIFTIAFGIAVDDTIHFMSKLKLELNKGKSMLYALKRTFISTGKAIIVTSIILVAGFLTLMYSDFNGTFYTGLLISLTLLFAVLADLILIPILLIYFFKKK